jgi:hypothetical protein
VAVMPSTSYGYFDESGKFKDSDFICIAGFVSDDPHWENFCEEWDQVLKHYKLPALHMTVLTAKDREQILPDFIDVIRRNVQIGIGVGLDVKSLKAMPSDFQQKVGDPQYFCFQRMLRTLVDNLRKNENYTGPVPITFDDTQEHAILCYRMWSKLRTQHQELKQSIPAITFADDEVIMQLQAADLLAHQTRATALRQMRDQQPSDNLFQRLMTPIGPVHTRYYEECFDRHRLEYFAAMFRSGEIPALT